MTAAPRGAAAPRREPGCDQGVKAATPVIQSVQRAGQMLDLFTTQQPRLSLGELTALTEMSKATVHRYATALRAAGLLRVDNGLYTLGPKVVELASAALEGLSVVRVASPYLDRLVAVTKETAVLSVWDGHAPVTVRVQDNTGSLVRIVVAVGSRLPLDSSQGQVFRAFLDRESHDPVLATVRERQLATNSLVVEGITTLAAPVFQGADITATIALVGTTASLASGVTHELARTLRDAAQGLSAELGFIAPD